jgi:hypothetical protein
MPIYSRNYLKIKLKRSVNSNIYDFLFNKYVLKAINIAKRILKVKEFKMKGISINRF